MPLFVPSVSEASVVGALVRKASDQTAANYTTATAVTFDQELYDTAGFHDNVTNNTRLTCPAGYSYAQLSVVLWTTNVTANDFMIGSVRKNGGFDDNVAMASQSSLTAPRVSFVTPLIPINVAGGDYFECFLQIGADTSITVTANETRFGIRLFN